MKHIILGPVLSCACFYFQKEDVSATRSLVHVVSTQHIEQRDCGLNSETMHAKKLLLLYVAMLILFITVTKKRSTWKLAPE